MIELTVRNRKFIGKGLIAGAELVGGVLLAIGGPCAPLIRAQAVEPPQFEVASIKPSGGGVTNQGANLVRFQLLPGGRLIADNFSPQFLIMAAYGLQDFQISGGPSWISYELYNIEAKAAGNPPGKEIAGPMLQALLKDRFKLTFHYDVKELPVYILTVANKGAKLQHSKEGGCIAISADAPPLGPLAADQTLCGFRGFEQNGLDRKLKAFGMSMTELADALSKGELRRMVIDRTGLTGNFDILMHWTLEIPAQVPIADDAGPLGAPTLPAETAGPSIFTALQEQLGLKLESGKGPLKVLVIDHIERPSGN
jgi:bla regulator protein blaR1